MAELLVGACRVLVEKIDAQPLGGGLIDRGFKILIKLRIQIVIYCSRFEELRAN